MDLRCPNCNSTDLKKVFLAYEEGLLRSNAHTRIRGVLVGSGGPDVIVGGAATKGTRQTALSKRLNPPVKWSYRKVIFWGTLAFLCGGWLVFYVNTITKNAATVNWPALTAYVLIVAVVFAVLLMLVIRHNHSVYPKRFAEWDRSFICQRCSMVIYQDSSVA